MFITVLFIITKYWKNNCYFEIIVNGTSAWTHSYLLGIQGIESHVSNTVFNFKEMNNIVHEARPALPATPASSSVANTYVISSKSNGQLVAGTDGGAFASIDAFKAYVATQENFLDAFSADWKLVNGVPMFKTAEQFAYKTGTVVGVDTMKQNSNATFAVEGATATEWTITGDSTEGITVENGVVTVASTVAAGTVFTVKAYATNAAIGKYLVASKNVTVEEVAEIVNIEAIENKSIYAAAAEGYANTVTVTPVVTVGGEAMEGGTVVLSTESDVVTIDGMTITGVKAGTATITVTATSALGTVQTATFTVTVARTPAAIANETEIIVDFNGTNTIDAAGLGLVGAVQAVKVGDAAATISYADGIVTITDATRGEYQTIVVETDVYAYTIPNVTIVDIEVKDQATVNTLLTAMYTGNKYAIVTASVDMANYGTVAIPDTATSGNSLKL